MPDKASSDDTSQDDAYDVALMMRVKETGDTAAFEEIVERHQHAVVGTVAKMLGGMAGAEDIAQEVFIRLWKCSKRYERKAKFTTFLFTITRNLVFNESRKRSKRKTYSMEEREEQSHMQVADDPVSSPDNSMLQAEMRKAVDKAIQDLPEKQRMAVVLRRYEQLSYEEIADVLDLTVSAVKSQLFRARATLRDALQHYMDA